MRRHGSGAKTSDDGGDDDSCSSSAEEIWPRQSPSATRQFAGPGAGAIAGGAVPPPAPCKAAAHQRHHQKLFRLLLLIGLLFLTGGDDGAGIPGAEAQQVVFTEESEAGKNHLRGIHRIGSDGADDDQSLLLEHRHLRHIAATPGRGGGGRQRHGQQKHSSAQDDAEVIASEVDQQQQGRPANRRQPMIVHGGSQPRPTNSARRVPIALLPTREAPSPARAGDLQSMTSAEAEVLARRLLAQAERLAAERRRASRLRHASSTTVASSPPPTTTTTTTPLVTSQPSTVDPSQRRMERWQARWRKIGPLIGHNSTEGTAPVPLRRLRLVQRRKIFGAPGRPMDAAIGLMQMSSLERTQNKVSSSAPLMTDPITTTTITTTPESTTVTVPSTTVTPATVVTVTSVEEETVMKQQQQQQRQQLHRRAKQPGLLGRAQQQQQPRAYGPALRALRERHRKRLEADGKQRRLLPKSVFSGPLLAPNNGDDKDGALTEHHERQFGLRTAELAGPGGNANRLEVTLITLCSLFFVPTSTFGTEMASFWIYVQCRQN